MKNILIALILLPVAVYGQSYKLSEKIDLEVIGTSTLHDWEMVSEEGTGTAQITIQGNELVSIEKLGFSIKTRTLKSGKGTMDNYCYDALKEDKHAEISFNLKQVSSITKSGTSYLVVAVGDLSIAGKTNPATIRATATLDSGKVRFVGEYDLKMTTFDVKPPTVMFGTIKTGDDIKVKFSVDYKEAGTL